ncbi:M60 family metallopeptidase [Sphingobacterium sp. UDSM-2020]|uniref:M60 family metallopeptidase n=1 Tax=Sphingobacterium sp. UDSM-2020 TaxID=2795738 RepID=UPI001938292E|nr:M60 family metallopeptidase [Sphingobacterium sp. UDSM-2020]QQD11711.1 PRTRC system protein C [Sphingobacterium sp. UDSM-2020]
MKKYIITTCFLISTVLLSLGQDKSDFKVFNDKKFTTLKKGVSDKEINAISSEVIRAVAKQLKSKTYPLHERIRKYESYQDPHILANRLKTGAYSQFENPTGIYFDQNDEIIAWVGDVNGNSISLDIVNWDDKDFSKETYKLKPGLNILKSHSKGNSYINYYTKEAKLANKIEVHILSGHINGVFQVANDDNKKWDQLLANAYGPILDIVGKKTQLAYSVASLKKYAPSQGTQLIQLYDSIITIQHELMGLVKYNKVPRNHMFGRVIWDGFMHADEFGAAFHDETMPWVAHIPTLQKDCWGVAHEFGHVNQVRPNMTWPGTTETTNNIYSVWTRYLFNRKDVKLEREALKDYDEHKVGGRITTYMESAFVHKQPWMTQAGHDRMKRENDRGFAGDHFGTLVPLWQLQLYMAVVGEGEKWGNKDFYADIFMKAINDPIIDAKENSYYQLSFIKNACDAAKLDLTDFFEHSGMLTTMDMMVDDYTPGRMTITEMDVREVKSYASQYNKPTTPVMHYLTANSIDIFKGKQPVRGTKNSGIEKQIGKIVIDNTKWENAVAFETYAGEKLLKVAFRGAGSVDDIKTTVVQTPEGYTRVVAVGWDGQRIEVI